MPCLACGREGKGRCAVCLNVLCEAHLIRFAWWTDGGAGEAYCARCLIEQRDRVAAALRREAPARPRAPSPSALAAACPSLPPPGAAPTSTRPPPTPPPSHPRPPPPLQPRIPPYRRPRPSPPSSALPPALP